MACKPNRTYRGSPMVWTLDGPAWPAHALYDKPRPVPFTRTSTRADRAERYVQLAYWRERLARSQRLRRLQSAS